MSHFTHVCTVCGHDREAHEPHPFPVCAGRYGCHCRSFRPGPSTLRTTYSFRMDETDAPPAADRVEPVQEPGELHRYVRAGAPTKLCDCPECVDAYRTEVSA